ncbi:sulfatase [Tengunoibacter tsumagoiensis]|uniref:Sulfatase n=1 Tax=Tengunoibacter tsumagoiensis TaxID=2014871 RepID=A0A401ZZJ9_9CHLR|nr:sulfatase [Tengunoibacter tsumagoiensis]GCE12222.1 sulfatase [Tengunoibacter tsumagoiensis]
MTLRPDIILLVLDTQRVDRLSCYGYGSETSPYLDELAAESTQFLHAYSAAQWTIPSHTSMFTGLYPNEHHMLHANSILSSELTPLAERLQQGGYATAAFCNNPLIGVVNTGLQRGFQSFLNYSGLLTSYPNQEINTKNSLDRYRTYFKRSLARVITNMQDAFARSDTLLDLSFSPLMSPLWQTALSFKGNTSRSLQDAARLHIERKGIAPDQPLFSFINLMGVHMPFHPSARFTERFAPKVQQDKATRRYLRQFNSDVFGWITPLTSDIDDQKKALLDGVYDAEVANQDEQVGLFLHQLRKSGALDNTLLIVCADHGEQLGEKQMMGHGISLSNTLVHVPLLIRDPSGTFPLNSTVEQATSTRRIFHTILTAAEEATNDEQEYTLAQSPGSDPDSEAFFAVGITPQNQINLMQRRRPDLLVAHQCDQPRFAIWQNQYKLIQTGDSRLELYDVFTDPTEQTDLQHILPEQVENLQERLRSFRQHALPVKAANARQEISIDPQVQRRLHDLGYIED